MNKEELKQEAEDFLQKRLGIIKMFILGDDAREVLADFAEPREHKITELEKENIKLKEEYKQLKDYYKENLILFFSLFILWVL